MKFIDDGTLELLVAFLQLCILLLHFNEPFLCSSVFFLQSSNDLFLFAQRKQLLLIKCLELGNSLLRLFLLLFELALRTLHLGLGLSELALDLLTMLQKAVIQLPDLPLQRLDLV